ncbi:protein of unknown function DUF169 [Solidesulfovibrio fructosivorans JJ]]|uniref:DUF169 domain-containing protein n=1 Tax=Solidesulfovibrio fructosivorans JJ] TaxID=596151 RepID=E1K085_SOLFR|nr:DUF169 domain-containing protein [Solidesulfovibrio fructosivorans]EFL50003.1 protein of unknown function DUF169 [Solidesulfovibrio fructosivorans JJ]]
MEELSYQEMQHVLMDELRLMHYPIAVKYFFDQAELDDFKERVSYYLPAKALTFCQAEIGARMEGITVLMGKEQLGCSNAKCVFGWKDIDAAEFKSHIKYCESLEQAERFVRSKPRMKEGLLAAAVSPLADAAFPPDVVHFYCDNMQAYHLVVDWMAVMDKHPLRPNMTMNSAACAGNVYVYNSGEANVFLACSGSYNAGKTERGEINVAIPGKDIGRVVARLKARKEREGGAAITRIGHPFPGADICKNCPLIVFKKAKDPAAATD